MAERPNQGDLKMEGLTRDQLKKIERSMKRPQFMGLLNEYMIQISDPKNKNQYDEYLLQMQRQKQLPKHMKIVEIKPKFCFRTFIVSQKNKKHEMKFFINMCESEYLQKPSCQPTQAQDGHMGYSWKIPNSMGKIRYDQDKKGSPCQVVDIAFHPDTYHFGVRKEFREMMINIALEAAERQLGERKETLSRDYVILQRVICKGADGKPALMPIRYIEGKVYNKGEGPTNEPERDIEGRETKLQQQINKQRQEHKKQKQKNNKQEVKQELQEQQVNEEKRLVVDLQQGVQRPKYSTIFTYPIDYSQFIDSPYTTKRKIPSVYNIEFHIPRVQSMEEVAGQKLQINDKKIVLKIGEKYFIDLQLQQLKVKYVLVTGSAKAKYDKKKKCLRIVIPVDQTVKYEQQKEEEQSKVEEIKQEPNVVENQTWKNKMLDFTEPSVSVQVIKEKGQGQVENAPLVQEIDDEDIIEETKVTTSQISHNQEEIQEQTKDKPQKFSISSYYGKQKKEVVQQQSRRIGFLFQQTGDKVVLVVQMKNYKREEIRTLVVGNRQILVQWNQNGSGESNPSLLKYEHLKIVSNFVDRIQKIELVFRVGFMAATVFKKKQEKGKYWQKESVESVVYEQETEQQRLDNFVVKFNLLNQQELKRVADKKQKEQIKVAQQKKVVSQKLSQQQIKQIKQQVAEPVHQDTQNQKKLTDKQASKQQNEPHARQQLFKSLQPQFIHFSAPFIDVLD